MPQRFLRPGITTSKRWNRCDWISQSLYARLITLVDDYGRYDADPELLRSLAFPFGDPEGQVMPVTTLVSSLTTLVDKDLLLIYAAEGKEYLQLTRWQERARSESKYPEPVCKHLQTNVVKCTPPSSKSKPSSKPSPSSNIDLLDGKSNGQTRNFRAIAVANRILANESGWDYDNCKVKRGSLKTTSLATVIEPWIDKRTQDQLLRSWNDAVRRANGAKVDGIAKNPTAYAVACFRDLLKTHEPHPD